MPPHIIDITLAACLTALFGAVGWLVSAVISHGKKVAKLEEALGGLKNSFEGLDVSTELRAVHRRVDAVATTTSKIDGEVSQISRTLGLIQDHLMSGDKR